MAVESAWRRWRREVHDILEVGGDAHPPARFVNVFIVVLIILNAVAFAAETVDHLAERYGTLFPRLQYLLGGGVHHRISAAAVERGGHSDAEPHEAVAGAIEIRDQADDADRPVRRAAVLFHLAGAGGSQGAAGAAPVPSAEAGALLAGAADPWPRHRRRVARSARRAAHHSGAAAVRVHRGTISSSARRNPTNSARSPPPRGGRSPP